MPKHKGHGSKPEWFNEQGDVITNTVKSAEKAQFIEWYALPAKLREPATFKSFAAAIGVAESTVHAWKKDPRVMASVRGAGQAAVVGSLSEITQTMVTIATDPDHKSAVAAARLLIDMVDKGEKAVDMVPLSDMSNDDLKELAAGLYDEFDDRGTKTA